MAKHSLRVLIADIIILFESEQKSDIVDLRSFFKYHRAKSTHKPNCTVVLKRQAAFRMPSDAQLQWQSAQNHMTGEQIGRRRIKVSPRLNTLGIASCYWSRERNEFYYGLMQDKSWICFCPSKQQIRCILHRPPARKGCLGIHTSPSPLTAILLLVHVITTAYGRFLIHGAAVCIKGRASLFLGPSGCGKSTLCTDLAVQKASFMGDDLVIVYIKDNVPTVGALLFPAKLYKGNDKEKREVDVPKEMHTKFCLSAPLQAVYSVKQNGLFYSEVTSRPSVELLQQLIEASNDMLMQYDRQQWLDCLYKISECTPYFAFDFGDRSAINVSLLTGH